MNNAVRGILATAAVVAAGCGGMTPEDFAGMYSGSGSVTVRNSAGQTQTQQYEDTVTLVASADNSQILLAGSCEWTAKVTGDRTFELVAKDCDYGPGACRLVEQLKAGKGKLSDDGKTLEFATSGFIVQSECQEPYVDGTFGYATNATLERK